MKIRMTKKIPYATDCIHIDVYEKDKIYEIDDANGKVMIEQFGAVEIEENKIDEAPIEEEIEKKEEIPNEKSLNEKDYDNKAIKKGFFNKGKKKK